MGGRAGVAAVAFTEGSSRREPPATFKISQTYSANGKVAFRSAAQSPIFSSCSSLRATRGGGEALPSSDTQIRSPAVSLTSTGNGRACSRRCAAMTGLTGVNGCLAALFPRDGEAAAMAALTAAASLAKPAATTSTDRRRRITHAARAPTAATETGSEH